MEALTKALEDLKAADARFHDLLDPVGHMAKATQALAVATAETLVADGGIAGIKVEVDKIFGVVGEALDKWTVDMRAMMDRVEAAVAKLEEPAAPIPPAPPQPQPSAEAPAPAPAAPVPQEAAPAAEAPKSPASG